MEVTENVIDLVIDETKRKVSELPENYKFLYQHISSWLVRTIIEAYNKQMEPTTKNVAVHP